MALEPFASEADMENRSLGEITTSSHPFLANELEAASRNIRNHCRWHIATVEQIDYVRRGPFVKDVWLPAMQIQSITAVTIDGAVWANPTVVDFDPDTGWTNLRGSNVEVKFIAGYSEVPEDLMTLTLTLAARGLGTSLGFVREQAGTVSVTHSQAGFNVAASSALLPHEKADLDATYRLGRLP